MRVILYLDRYRKYHKNIEKYKNLQKIWQMSMKKYVCWADLFFLSIYLFTVLSWTRWNQKKFFSLMFIQFIYYSFSLYICNYNRVTFVLYLVYYNFSLLVFGFRIIDNIVLHGLLNQVSSSAWSVSSVSMYLKYPVL